MRSAAAKGKPLDLEKLRKIWALTSSSFAGEAASAKRRAEAMVKASGLKAADIPRLLAQPAPAPPNPFQGFNPFAGFDEYMEKQEPGYRARRAREDAEKRQKEHDDREELLRRFGSEEAVLARTPAEEALHAAVLPWAKFQEPPGDTRWIASIDGWSDPYALDTAPPRVLRAISDAIPLPTTITDAEVECLAWEARDREFGLVFENLGDWQIDLPCQVRFRIVEKLLDETLRARDVREVLIRQRRLVNGQMQNPDLEEAILADLEALAAQAPAPPAYRGPMDDGRIAAFQADVAFVRTHQHLLREYEQAQFHRASVVRGVPPSGTKQEMAWLAGVVRRRMESANA